MSGPADLYGRYAQLYDAGRAADFAALFTSDAIFVTGGVERARGRAAIEEMARAGRAALPGVRHLVSSVAVDVDGGTATGSAYVQAVQIDGASIRLVTLGHYEDSFVREDGQWRFAAHTYTPFTGSDLRDAVTAEGRS